MTVAEFIEWLKTQDQGATVEVVVGRSGRGWEGDSVSTEDFDPSRHADYTDLRGNPHVSPHASYFNKRSLLLGETP